ncbi:leucine-rich repeat receptor-like protein kinase [Rhypophila decipiens]
METTRRFENDPFRVDGGLGQGRSAVEQVSNPQNPGVVWARKRFFLPERPDPILFKDIQKEISIMKRLKHTHIVQFSGSYICRNLFYVLLTPVAEENLASFFRRTQALAPRSPERTLACRKMLRWPTCLFRALDYVHSMRVRHKDIKPANILIEGDRILLTDFGISNDFLDLTTSKTDGPAGWATWIYAAPEMYHDQRRGRATDIWALGCVVAELCTVASGNTLDEFENHRRGHQRGQLAAAYHTSPFRLFDWMWLLMGSPGPDDQASDQIRKLIQLAFLMLDPDPQRRITSRQIVDLLRDPRYGFFADLADLACDRCNTTWGISPQDIPLHSIFKKNPLRPEALFRPSKENFAEGMPNLWEEIKIRWLDHHIWWVDDALM